MAGNKKGVRNGFPLIIKASKMKYEDLTVTLLDSRMLLQDFWEGVG